MQNSSIKMMQPREFVGGYAPSDTESDTNPHGTKGVQVPAKTIASRLALSRLSQSETQLYVPHFVHGQDEHVASLSRVLSGLFEVDAALSTPLSRSRRDLTLQSSTTNPDLQISASNNFPNETSIAGTHCSSAAPSDVIKSVRKSATFVTWADTNTAGPSSFHQLNPYLPPDDGGLIMATTGNNSQLSANRERLSSKLEMSSSHPDNASQEQSQHSLLDSSDVRAPAVTQHGGVFSVFGRGFFAKPVIRSEEENYRYLMALDR